MDSKTILNMTEKSTEQIHSLSEIFSTDMAGKVAIVTGSSSGYGRTKN